jgi:hypothetical protein
VARADQVRVPNEQHVPENFGALRVGDKGSGPGAGHSKRIVVVIDFRSVMRDPVKRVAFIAESREKAAAERLDMVARREEWIGEAGFGATEGREMPSLPRRLLRRRKRCRGSGNRLAVRRQETIPARSESTIAAIEHHHAQMWGRHEAGLLLEALSKALAKIIAETVEARAGC